MQKWKKNKLGITAALVVCLIFILSGIVIIVSKSDFDTADKDMSIDVSLDSEFNSETSDTDVISTDDKDTTVIQGNIVTEQNPAADDISHKNDPKKEVAAEQANPNEKENSEGIPYEYWLAAAMVAAISLQHDEFELEDIYLTGETGVSEKYQSGGVYVVYSADGNRTILHSEALEEEREESGTMDLYTHNLGFATFDVVQDVIDENTCISVEIDDIDELIALSLLVSIYER